MQNRGHRQQGKRRNRPRSYSADKKAHVSQDQAWIAAIYGGMFLVFLVLFIAERYIPL